MSIRVAVTYMILFTANLGRVVTALRSTRSVPINSLTSFTRSHRILNSVRLISCTSKGHYIASMTTDRHIVASCMVLTGHQNGPFTPYTEEKLDNTDTTDNTHNTGNTVTSDSSAARQEIIDEEEEIPLSDDEVKAKEIERTFLEEELDDDVGDDSDEEPSDPSKGTFFEGSLRLKVRQHVNPLASRYLIPMEGGEEWVAKAFSNTSLPVVVDIGCAKGSWVLKFGLENPHLNIVGLEIRKPVVEFALARKKKWGLTNVHFLDVNANVDLNRILTDLKSQGGSVEMVTIQFPDPHFKKKHKKRRVVNEELVKIIVDQIEVGKKIFLQSDILDVTEDMIQHFGSNEQLEIVEGYDPVNLTANVSPNNVLTEREIATQKKGLPVYRMMFRKINKL